MSLHLPVKSSLKQAMQGYPEDSPSSSSSSSRNSSLNHTTGCKQRRNSSGLSDSGSSSGDDLFRHEPKSDHSSDMEQMKCHKHEKHRRYRAKLNALKYQKLFLKQDPPETYDGVVVVSKIKKWYFSILDLKKNG